MSNSRFPSLTSGCVSVCVRGLTGHSYCPGGSLSGSGGEMDVPPDKGTLVDTGLKSSHCQLSSRLCLPHITSYFGIGFSKFLKQREKKSGEKYSFPPPNRVMITIFTALLLKISSHTASSVSICLCHS